ncbi:MAG TPA: carboxypeptidase-like regulatory domain-containing protein [Candidatus Angelobacter sp.]|nr:carboxypeptidase-like regulatory domain-containing protein [Candidatus Angelobacter sp.]
MKKLPAVLIVALASVCAFSASGLAEPMQRGQAESRMLIGRVFNRQDQPVAKAIVYLKNAKTLAIKTYITEPDGSYRFPALAPNVDYEVYAESNGARSDTKTLSGFDSRKTANITLKLK